MEVNYGNRNCHNCGGFGHLARNCRNREIGNRIGEDRRWKYKRNKSNKEMRMIEEGNKQNNLNGNKNLIVLN